MSDASAPPANETSRRRPGTRRRTARSVSQDWSRQNDIETPGFGKHAALRSSSSPKRNSYRPNATDARADAVSRAGVADTGCAGWDIGADFDLDGFLDRPLVARLATVSAKGQPRVRPIWYLFDRDGFWWITGSWSQLDRGLQRNPAVELVVDTCDLASGEVLQVRARGQAELHPFDAARAERWGERYMGRDRSRWGRFQLEVFESPDSRFMLLRPTWLRARDLSWGS